MHQLCQAVVWLDSNHHSNSYCMRAVGHEGKHNPDGPGEPVDPAANPASNNTPAAVD
jgi:hypothetical protein